MSEATKLWDAYCNATTEDDKDKAWQALFTYYMSED